MPKWSSGLAGALLLFGGIADAQLELAPGTHIVFPDGSMQAQAFPSDHGGTDNAVTGDYAFIGGGRDNIASGDFATIGGGGSDNFFPANVVTGYFGTIGGGASNHVGPDDETGYARYSTIGGGKHNRINADFCTVAGGWGNFAGYSSVSGYGRANTVAGGESNGARGQFSTVGGGQHNRADNSTISGGDYNHASNFSFVGGGNANQATGLQSTIGGGFLNTASGDYAVVAGGADNVASGESAAVPGGYENTASGKYSFAAGRNAVASHDSSFVWGGATGGTSAAANTFNVHAASIRLNGVVLHSSDRDLKADLEAVDPTKVLTQVAKLPVQTWRFVEQAKDVQHMGPTAQDFMNAFGLGEDDRYITATDATGVALAAIQGLILELEKRDERIRSLEDPVMELAAGR